jgi:hypothetical protein
MKTFALIISVIFSTASSLFAREPSNDTLYHYYINGSISVKIHPWTNDKRTIELFDLYGQKTFSTEDIRLSYTQFNQLHFHPNGAVSKIEESYNPGASLYHYTAVMTFGTTNDPIIRTHQQWPSTVEEHMKGQLPWFWNKKNQQWVQQEIVIETSTPER